MAEIKSIGDYALVVDIITPYYVCRLHRASRKIVYITLMIVEGGLDVGILCLDDGSIQAQYPGVSKSKFSLPIWIVPNPC